MACAPCAPEISRSVGIGETTMMKNAELTYGIVAKTFHWLLFLLLALLVLAGNFLASLPKGPDKHAAAGMHKSFGLIVLVLVLARLAWRLANVTPKDPEGTRPIEAFLGHAMHWGLYVLMIAQPMSGILMSQAAGQPAGLFGLVDLPTLVSPDEAEAKLYRAGHGTIWIVLVLAVVGHAMAALYHHFVKRDDVLVRMSPRRPKS